MKGLFSRALLLPLAVLLIVSCTFINNYFTYVEEDVPTDQWVKSSEARKGYIFVSGMMTPVTASAVIKKMMELDGYDAVERIRLIINTNGGEANSYRSILNGMGMLQKPVDTVNVGSCYSAGVGLFASASGKRYAFPNTHFMIHRPFADEGGGDADAAAKYETEIFETTIRKRSHLPDEWFPLSDKMIFFTAEEAKGYQLVDEIITELP